MLCSISGLGRSIDTIETIETTAIVFDEDVGASSSCQSGVKVGGTFVGFG